MSHKTKPNLSENMSGKITRVANQSEEKLEYLIEKVVIYKAVDTSNWRQVTYNSQC